MNSRQRRKLRRKYERVAEASRRLMRSWLSRPMPKVDRDEIDSRSGFLAPTTIIVGVKSRWNGDRWEIEPC